MTSLRTAENLTTGGTVDSGSLGTGVLVLSAFRIDNAGEVDLTGLYVTIEGADAAMFAVIDAPPRRLEAHTGAGFTVQAKLSGAGTKMAAIRIATNDFDEPVFVINLKATVDKAVMPMATTLAASNVSLTTATLNGVVNAKGSTRAISFDYGTTTAYGNTLLASPAAVATSADAAVSLALNGLQPHAVYHFRVRAVGDLGSATGADQTFTTGNTAPIAAADSFVIVQPVTTLPVLANDTDADGDQAHFAVTAISSALAPRSAGTLALSGGRLVFTASPAFLAGTTGAVTFSYAMTDGFEGTSSRR